MMRNDNSYVGCVRLRRFSPHFHQPTSGSPQTSLPRLSLSKSRQVDRGGHDLVSFWTWVQMVAAVDCG